VDVRPSVLCFAIAVAALAPLHAARTPAAQARADAAASAKTWVGRAAEIEAYLRTAPVTRTEGTGRGVTKPTRAFFGPGGAVASMTWKALPPGRTGGYYESYKSEIAAYEIDKLLDLNMVPPKVERRLEGERGVAVMWVEPAKSFADLGGVPQPPPAMAAKFTRELVRAKMFHNLVGDIDPNLGNWLVDPAWNIILIDQSRAFTTTKTLVHEMQHVDRPLWNAMRELTEAGLSERLSSWLDRGQVRALLSRRDRLQEQIDRLVRKNGEARVFIGGA
jgi:hypothetical protein